jgi:2-polyprenyl-6-methoxyphenol hydroxylase-like FAD-dependent oxidoreductase
MAEQVWDTLILGAGPVGLVTALAAARSGRVLVMAPRIPQNTQALRIDSVPLALLALFVEFGLHPSEINAGETHDHRLAAWEAKPHR